MFRQTQQGATSSTRIRGLILGRVEAEPLVDVELPNDIREGVKLAEGQPIRVVPTTTGITNAVTVEDKLFYANALLDTDILVKPTVGGFETFHQLRSAASPEVLSFTVEMPAGAQMHLRRMENGPQWIEIVRDGQQIATVSPPVAADADGVDVPVTYSVEGNRIDMHVPHRDKDLMYPIMVDPNYQYAYWNWNGGYPHAENWTPTVVDHCNGGMTAVFGQGWYHRGLLLYGANGAGPCGGDYGNFSVGNWARQSQRASHIYAATWYDVTHPYRFTCVLQGIYRPWTNDWEAGQQFRCHDLTNDNYGICTADGCPAHVGQPNNKMDFNLRTWGVYGNRNPGPYADMGGAAVYMSDNDNPIMVANTNSPQPTGWVRSGQYNVSPVARDPGLGMKRFRLRVPGYNDMIRDIGCTLECPEYFGWPSYPNGQPGFAYDIAQVPEGIQTINLWAYDATDKWVPGGWQIKVDKTAPTVEASGDLAGRDGQTVPAGAYSLKVTAKDDTTTSPTSVTQSGVKGLNLEIVAPNGTVVRQSPSSMWTDVCAAGENCSKSDEILFNAETYGARYGYGTYTFRYSAWDQVDMSTGLRQIRVTFSPGQPAGHTADDGDNSLPTLSDDEGLADFCNPDAEVSGGGDCSAIANDRDDSILSEPSLAPPDINGNPKISVGSPNWGWSDQQNEALSDPRFTRLGIKKVRIVVPWDAVYRYRHPDRAYTEKQYAVRQADGSLKQYKVPSYNGSLDNVLKYVEKARALNQEILLGFETTYQQGEDPAVPGLWVDMGPRVLPSVALYRQQTDAIIDAVNHPENYRRLDALDEAGKPVYGQPYGAVDTSKYVRTFTAWNEPNYKAQPTSGDAAFPNLPASDRKPAGARRAGQYWSDLYDRCRKATPKCSVIAGDFADGSSFSNIYFTNYVSKLTKRPTAWAIHAHTQGYNHNSSWLRTFLKRTAPAGASSPTTSGPPVWITEAGAKYHAFGNDWTRGASDLNYLLLLPEIGTRIKRFYHYSMYGASGWDTGMVDPALRTGPQDYDEGDLRKPAYCTYVQKVIADPANYPQLCK